MQRIGIKTKVVLEIKRKQKIFGKLRTFDVHGHGTKHSFLQYYSYNHLLFVVYGCQQAENYFHFCGTSEEEDIMYLYERCHCAYYDVKNINLPVPLSPRAPLAKIYFLGFLHVPKLPQNKKNDNWYTLP